MAEHICPWWLGYFHICPVRKLLQNPNRIVAPYLQPGMTVLEIGPGMGFFTLPMAKLIGPSGKVIAVDIQPKMLASLKRRAAKAGLSERIEIRLCDEKSLHIKDLSGQINFALLFAVLHELPDQGAAFTAVFQTLKSSGKILIAEPKGHVSRKKFDEVIAAATATGFAQISAPQIPHSHAALMTKP